MNALVFDLGGTFLRGGVASPDRQIKHISKSRIPNVAIGCANNAIWNEIANRIVAYEHEHGGHLGPAAPIVIAFPGPVSGYRHAHQAATVAGNSKSHADIASVIEARTGRRVLLLNDVSAAAWRIAEITAARRFLVVTVSSGIGSKMFVRESGVLDDLPFGGEIGHVVVDHSHLAPICDCGAKGHLGAVASGRGVERYARIRAANDESNFSASKVFWKFYGTPQRLTNEHHLVPAILDGDPWALGILRDCTLPLAKVLLLIAVAAGLDRVFVMGGFAQSIEQPYLDLLRTLAAQSSRFDLTEDRLDSMFEFAPDGGEICLQGCLAFLRQADRLGVSPRLTAVESYGAMPVTVAT